MPLPTSTIPTSISLETDATPSRAVRTQAWDEPHPGRRLSLPNPKNTSASWGIHNGHEGRRGGMAAEGLWPDHAANFSFAASAAEERRHARGRVRNVPKELVITDDGHSRPEIQTAPLPRSSMQQRHKHQHRVYSTTTEDHIAEVAEPASIDISTASSDMSGSDSDTDSNISGPPRKRVALHPLDTSFRALQFADVPNQFGISMDVDASEHSSFSTVSDAAAFSVMSPGGDLYGWNTVLDCKPAPLTSETSAPYQQRRASRSKRSLLQRVFSPGGQDVPSDSAASFTGSDFSETQER